LYFASDGHPGLGGLDIFVTQLKDDGTYGKIKNVGEPVNSNFDDFGFIMNTDTKTGYFSSNREKDNLGYDDIYKCTETRPIPKDCQQNLKGVVVDSNTKVPIQGVKLVLFDINYVKFDEKISDATGRFDFGTIDCGNTFRIISENIDFDTLEKMVLITKDSDLKELEILMTPKLQPIQVGSDLRKTLGIEIIYFDLDKANIRKDAEVELAKILEVMKQYPTMEIDVRSHTDSRQTEIYNFILSNKRAKATIKWLVDKGIDPKRLTGKGYGESQLVNKCSDDVLCSEAEHQVNRRSEFIIKRL
jgi:outer membrane protein OmpA-like peptidoglycan-associated protein